jgi:hypothetical protein
MSITDTYSVGVSGSDSVRASGSSAETGTTRLAIDTNLAASSTNVLVAAAWTVANTQSIFLLSTTNCTIKTNSSGAPANTINLIAGIPLEWRASAGYYANPFTTNVTAWYVTSTAATRLQAIILTT